MNLQEKILYCRKKQNMSQEALAEKVGVSRQAVSKWETGETTPEITKLKALAETFGVTADWLLSEDEPQENANTSYYESQENSDKTTFDNTKTNTNGCKNVFDEIKNFGKRVEKYTWYVGVYIAIIGLIITIFGYGVKLVMNSSINAMVSIYDSFEEDDYDFSLGIGGEDYISSDVEKADTKYDNMTSSLYKMANGMYVPMIVVGMVITIGGVVLAVVLRNKTVKKKE